MWFCLNGAQQVQSGLEDSAWRPWCRMLLVPIAEGDGMLAGKAERAKQTSSHDAYACTFNPACSPQLTAMLFLPTMFKEYLVT